LECELCKERFPVEIELRNKNIELPILVQENINFIEKYYSNQNVIIWNAFIQSNTIQKSYLIVDDFVQEVSDLTQIITIFCKLLKIVINNTTSSN
jgi:hypothetical protein